MNGSTVKHKVIELVLVIGMIWLLSTTFLAAAIDPPTATDTNIPFPPTPHSPGLSRKRRHVNQNIVIPLVVATILVGAFFLLLLCYWIYRRKTSRAKTQQCLEASKGISLGPVRTTSEYGSVPFIDYQLIVDATNNFDNDIILGQGGGGRVYKALFRDHFVAAVKRIHGEGRNVKSQFENEISHLSKIQHQNVVPLLGYCIYGETRFLVYEMMPNGSLESQLHGPSKGSALTWSLRMKIALDIARGLEYLHEHCSPPLIHNDLNSSNILLDSNFSAKISDFGLAVSKGTLNRSNVMLSGTLGYAAPEYMLHGKLTEGNDVYAYGVILLELLTGGKAVERISPAEFRYLISRALYLTDRSKLPNMVAPVMREMHEDHLYQVAAVAAQCLEKEPTYRPLIKDVLHSFIPLVPVEFGGSQRLIYPAVPPVCT